MYNLSVNMHIGISQSGILELTGVQLVPIMRWVHMLQDTQSSSHTAAVPVIKPGQSPLRWSQANPQVRPIPLM